MACTHGCVRDASAPRLVNTTVDTDTRRQLVHMRGGHALWRSCMRAGQSCRACARLRRRVGALHPNSDLAGPSCTPIASNRLRSLPSKQANLAIEGASLSFIGRIRAGSSHNVCIFLGATVFTGMGNKVRHPALQAHNDCTGRVLRQFENCGYRRQYSKSACAPLCRRSSSWFPLKFPPG